MADVTKAAGAGEVSPLAKHFLAKSPEKTNLRLRQIAVELLNETGDRPDADDVLARYEQVRRAELEELGIDPASLSKTDTKKPDPQADKKPSAKTLANDLSTSRVPRPKSSERELRAETRAALLSGRLDE
jgi:DNA-binding SARP family transcriptional activator